MEVYNRAAKWDIKVQESRLPMVHISGRAIPVGISSSGIKNAILIGN